MEKNGYPLTLSVERHAERRLLRPKGGSGPQAQLVDGALLEELPLRGAACAQAEAPSVGRLPACEDHAGDEGFTAVRHSQPEGRILVSHSDAAELGGRGERRGRDRRAGDDLMGVHNSQPRARSMPA